MVRSRMPVFLGKRLFTASSLGMLAAMPAASVLALMPPSDSWGGMVVRPGDQTQPWVIADKDDDDDKDDKDDDDDKDDKNRSRRRNRAKGKTKIRVQEIRGWQSYVSVARLVNSNDLVLQLNVLQKPVTSYANVVYVIYARQQNQWVQVYTSTGAKLIANQAGRVILPPEVIRLNQLRLGNNVDYSQLELRVDTQIRYDIRGVAKDQQVVFEQPCDYGSLTQISSVEQINTIVGLSQITNTTGTTTSTTTGTTTQASAGQSVTLTNGYRVTFRGVSYSGNTSTWRYYVEELPVAKDLSNWVLGLPACTRVVAASPKGEFVNSDPNARIRGIKWQPGGGFVQGEFAVTLNGRWGVGTTTVAVKGPDVARGQLAGPSCGTI